LAQYFLDTSAAVKYYHVEPGTPRVTALFAEPVRKIRISSLGFLEIQSAFAMKVRSGILSYNAAGLQRSRFLLDVGAGDIEVYSLTGEHYTTAEQLIGRYSFRYRLRTLDALQLAVAVDLFEQALLDYFVVADQSLGDVATLEGLSIVNPEVP